MVVFNHSCIDEIYLTMENDYNSYSVEDFLTDDYFVDWVLQPNNDLNEFWSDWMLMNPHKLSIINESKKTVLFLKGIFTSMDVDNDEVENDLQRILNLIKEE